MGREVLGSKGVSGNLAAPEPGAGLEPGAAWELAPLSVNFVSVSFFLLLLGFSSPVAGMAVPPLCEGMTHPFGQAPCRPGLKSCPSPHPHKATCTFAYGLNDVTQAKCFAH